ncbi:MAG: hypothetical protein HY314_04940 [Acidobacteria bacterium]|nr:hypothetical protein [Acidobacteriota bacterium]
MNHRREKITSLTEAIRQVVDGSQVAVGGLSYFNAPMALVRELIRQRKRDLTLITAAISSFQADLLIGAGCVRRLISPYVAFEELGLAPNFRRAVEKGEVELVEIGEAFLAFALKAAASGSPFYALPRSLAAADTARISNHYRIATDPFTGQEVLCVPALRPDWAILHAQQSDPFGNVRYLGSPFMDPLLARASRHVIISCDELISNETIRSDPWATAIPAMMVDRVVPIHGAAHPTASEPLYGVDREHFKLYIGASKTTEGLADYLHQFVISASDPEEYLAKVGGLKPTQPPVAEPVNLDAPPSMAETMATVFARCIEDGYFVGVGTGCWEVAAGVKLAQLTHAPNLSFSMGGTAALNPQLDYLPLSVNSSEAIHSAEAVIELENLFDLELNGTFDAMFASGLQIDQFGNLNLACIGDPSAPKLRGPGSVGLEFTPCVKRLVAFFRRHTRHAFVEKVDFISGPGYLDGPSSRSRFGMDETSGPYLVVTNLAVMDFDPESKRMRLKSVHPGVSVQEVKENTAFQLIIPESVETTPLPAQQELKLLRTVIDRHGLLRTLI